ncbi:MAG TPA: BamA/TamA family outer membrane protein [Dyella sp.]|uniref:BamA/TamA family outer membrane protein n=1 Tax=Dyella sp. TaxID=1869338 RepID=UPI002D77888F|nr:BamA/TamA family outer membrane protein [Dyella sp.]HET6552234.1 BamA/TamA family outer membrane protein [Dyella sp.]
MSQWLLKHKGALLVPIIITEPAVGTGGGLAAVFFHRPAQSEESKERGERLPPDIYGIGAFKTENGTWGTGLGGSFHFDDDSWRYAGLAGKASVNLDFYTQGTLLEPRKIGYNLDGIFSYQQVSRRFGRSDWFASARWIYMDLDSRLNLQSDNQYFKPKDFAQRASGLGLGLSYDSRDNTLTPSKGVLWRLEGTAYAPAFGSDNTFQTYRTHIYDYIPFASSCVLGLRADLRSARGDVPFYQLPSIDLRGISYGRYQDQNVGMLEAELRWNLNPRWALLGFGGAGKAWGRSINFGDASTRTTEGVGFRYLMARALGLYVGLDFARSQDDHAFYIQVGSAWR